VAPLAAELGLAVESCPALVEGQGAKALKLVRSLVDDKVALRTHGGVIPDVAVTATQACGRRHNRLLILSVSQPHTVGRTVTVCRPAFQ